MNVFISGFLGGPPGRKMNVFISGFLGGPPGRKLNVFIAGFLVVAKKKLSQVAKVL